MVHVQTKNLRTLGQKAALPIFMLAVAAILFSAPLLAADKSTAPQLIALAQSNSPTLHDAILTTFDPADVSKGIAWIGRGPDFFFAVQARSKPALVIDDAPGPETRQFAKSDLWYAIARIEPLGKLHSFHYVVDGQKFGGRLDLPAFAPDSYQQAGVPSGKLSEKIIHTSKIYDGMKSDYWIYVPGAVRSQNSRRAHGFSGWRVVHRSQRQQPRAQRHRQPDRAEENSRDDLPCSSIPATSAARPGRRPHDS